MTFESLLVQELKKITTLNDNIYPLAVPESVAEPYIAYCQSGGEYYKTLDGYSEESEVSYEINILSSKYSQLKALEKEVVAILKALVNKKVNNSIIQEVDVQMPIEQYEEAIKLKRANISFTVFY